MPVLFVVNAGSVFTRISQPATSAVFVFQHPPTTAGGQLTEAVRRRPYSVVLLDEVEKAHREVLNVLLGVLDDGRLTDGKGRTVSFANTIIIMTSNVGSDLLLTHHGDPGAAHDDVMQLVRSTFRPEFLNRLDEIILFHPLQPQHLRSIAKLQVDRLNARMVDRNVRLQFDQDALDFVVKQSYDPSFGARPLRRWLEQHVVRPNVELKYCDETL